MSPDSTHRTRGASANFRANAVGVRIESDKVSKLDSGHLKADAGPGAEIYDLLIVGAGFAGLAAAKRAASCGLKVLVVEAKSQIGSHLHTSGILVEEAYQFLAPPAELVRPISRVRLYGPDRAFRDLEQANYRFYTTDTAKLVQWQADEALAAGAEIRLRAPFIRGSQTNDLVDALVGPTLIRARFVIGADGAKSTVASAFGLGLNTKFLVGVERENRDTGTMEPDLLHVFLDARIAPGYIAWAAVHPTGAQIGLAVTRKRSLQLERFKAEIEGRFRMDPAQEYERRAGLIPTNGLVHPWIKNRVLLAGDAAGMVSPLTAGGIRTALQFGDAAGEKIAQFLVGNAKHPSASLRSFLPRFGNRHVLRWLADQNPPNVLLQAAVDFAPLTSGVRRLFFNRIGQGSGGRNDRA